MQGEFVLLGDALWLDFINTRCSREADPPDLLADAREWTRWCGLMQLTTDPASHPAALTLRDQLTSIATALATGAPVPSQSLRALNLRLQDVPGRQQLVRVSGRWELPFVPANQPGTLDRIALSAAKTLALPQAEVRICAGPTCSLFLLDQSPQLTRRWCSPTHCGRGMRVERRRRTGR